MIKYVFFDLDGTLLPMNLEDFSLGYTKLLCLEFAKFGYEAEKVGKALMLGIKKMISNDGSKTNEERFWEGFKELFNEDVSRHQEEMNQFYLSRFNDLKSTCPINPLSKKLVDYLKEKEIPLVLATNPLFPEIATEQRIKWAGLNKEDFILITTYENERFCKPNLDYYRSIVERLGCQYDECLMIGNDVDEDMIAANLGMKVFLLTDYLINRHQKNIDEYPHGNITDLMKFLEKDI